MAVRFKTLNQKSTRLRTLVESAQTGPRMVNFVADETRQVFGVFSLFYFWLLVLQTASTAEQLYIKVIFVRVRDS